MHDIAVELVSLLRNDVSSVVSLSTAIEAPALALMLAVAIFFCHN